MRKLETAIQLRKDGKLSEANEILKELVQEHPNDPTVQYQYAWSFDALGKETDAIACYEKAISLGLNDEDLKGAYLGLGSTYRAIGEYEKSKDVFAKAMTAFPQDNAMKTFYAMTLYHLKEYSRSVEILLALLAETSSDHNINQYRKAIELYSTDIDKVW